MPKLISTATTKIENEFMTLERYWKSVFYFGQRLQQKYIFYEFEMHQSNDFLEHFFWDVFWDSRFGEHSQNQQ
jgi:hypothetical protein